MVGAMAAGHPAAVKLEIGGILIVADYANEDLTRNP